VIVTVSASRPSYTSFLQSQVGGVDGTESGHREEVSHADAVAVEGPAR
jgi:hypothetical protein